MISSSSCFSLTCLSGNLEMQYGLYFVVYNRIWIEYFELAVTRLLMNGFLILVVIAKHNAFMTPGPHFQISCVFCFSGVYVSSICIGSLVIKSAFANHWYAKREPLSQKTKSDSNSNNRNYIKILESDWSSAGLISAVIVQLHTSCACNWTVVRVMPE